MSNYTDLKNHMHNTLKITKPEIREMVDKAIYKIVEERLEVFLEKKMTVDELVNESIKKKLNQKNWFWGESEDTLDDYIKKEVVHKLTDGVHLKVEVVGKKNASPKHPTVKVRKIKG